jgi:Lrp/AsnC family transcriptional regulator, leucine-responsive regulatory protein
MVNFEKYPISWKEKKILKELDLNARQSLSKIGNKVRLSKQVVKYHLDKMIEDGIIKEFITYIDIKKLGYTFYDVVFKLKYIDKKNMNKIIKKINNLPNIGWLCSLNGEWQLIACIMAKNSTEFGVILEEILSFLKDALLNYEFFIVVHASQLAYKNFYDFPKNKYGSNATLGFGEPVNVSNDDLKILKILSNNSRISTVKISNKLNISLEKVRYSMKKLEKTGVIQAYKPLIDMNRVGFDWHVMFIQFKHSDEVRKQELIDLLKSMPEVFYVVRAVGNWNIMVEFQTKDSKELDNARELVLSKFSDLIRDERTVKLTAEHKCTFLPGQAIV